MRKRMSGCGGLEMLLTSQSVWRWLMTSRVPRWWTRPVYRAATRLLTNKMNAAACRHAFKLAKDIPVVEEVLKHTYCYSSTQINVFDVTLRTYHRRSYRKAAPDRWTWTLCEEANWSKGFNHVSLAAEHKNTLLISFDQSQLYGTIFSWMGPCFVFFSCLWHSPADGFTIFQTADMPINTAMCQQKQVRRRHT